MLLNDVMGYIHEFYIKTIGYCKSRMVPEHINDLILVSKALFLLDSKGVAKLCDSSRFWLIVEKLITSENKDLNEMGPDLQSRRILS